MTPRSAAWLTAAAVLTGCGGGSPLDNPANVDNPGDVGGQKLSFAYFQKCIDPIFRAPLPFVGGNATCASGGCHDAVSGTGGALRIVAGASEVDLASTPPDAARTSDMYKNFYSSQGVTVIGAPTQSRLFAKPLTLNVLHGGGQVFANDQDPNARQIAYWISHPMPSSQDEFGSAGAGLLTATGECQTP